VLEDPLSLPFSSAPELVAHLLGPVFTYPRDRLFITKENAGFFANSKDAVRNPRNLPPFDPIGTSLSPPIHLPVQHYAPSPRRQQRRERAAWPSRASGVWRAEVPQGLARFNLEGQSVGVH
jgi:hypothetical protein